MHERIDFAHKLAIPATEVRTFYASGWNRPLVLAREDFYQWQFLDAPSCKGKDHTCLATDGDRLVGVMGVTPRDFLLKEQTLPGAEMTTWLLAESHKGGLGALMMDFLQRSHTVLFGANVTEAALQIYLRKGFTRICMPRFVRIFNWEAVKPFLRSTPLARKVHNDAHRTLLHEDAGRFQAEAVSKNALDSIVDAFRQSHSLFSRYFPDMSWRYAHHPWFTYHMRIIRAGNRQGSGAFLAWRLDEAIEGFSMLHILDLFGDTASVRAAIGYIQQLALEKGVDAVDFSTTSTRIGACFREARWFSLLDDSIFSFPHLFHPVEHRDPPVMSLVYWAKKGPFTLHDVGRLYITKEDLDLDRPGPAQIHAIQT